MNIITKLFKKSKSNNKRELRKPLKRRDNTRKAHNTAARPPETLHEPDNLLIILISFLSIFGILMIYSGSFYVASQKFDTILYPYNPYHFLVIQSAWLLISIIGMYFFYRVPMHLIKQLIMPMMIGVGVLLIVVLASPATINGAKQWIVIGPYTLQPSEFAKIALVLFTAAYFHKEFNINSLPKDSDFFQQVLYYTRYKLLGFIVPVSVIIGLVFLGRDFATAALMLGIVGLIYFLAETNIYHTFFSWLAVALAPIFVFLSIAMESYRQNRLNTYLDLIAYGKISDPLNTGYQLRQILIAVGSGGLFGVGFGQSRQKYFYLQETAFTDTIFAVIAEEFGFVGSVLLVAALLILVFRGLKIAKSIDNRFMSMTAVGISMWILLQSFVHLAVNVGLIPLTGMTLPLISYGGSSLLATFCGLGLLLNISKHVKLD